MPSDKRTEFLRELLALCHKHDVELSAQYGTTPTAEEPKRHPMYVKFRSGESIVDVEVYADVARGTWDGNVHAIVL